LLMEGILRQKVNFVLVVRRENNYYLPPEDECFAPLLTAYPGAFRSVYQAPDFNVYHVVANGSIPGPNIAVAVR